MRKLLALALAALLALGCSKDDGVGAYGISGTPVITSLEVGYERVAVTWEHNTSSSDSNYTNIYWSGGDSSWGQAITTSTGSTITLTLTAENGLKEGEHTFYVQNVNTLKGTSSEESASVRVYVYGADYCSSLSQRAISNISYNEAQEGDTDSVDITWGSTPSDDGFIGNRLYYLNRAGDATTLSVSETESKTAVTNSLTATEFDYASLYLPDGCIDTLVSPLASEVFPYTEGSPITVGSLKAMQPYFAMDNIHVTLEMSDYSITMSDIYSGAYENYAEVVEGTLSHALFMLTGSCSIYDFGGSTITVSTDIYDYSGYRCHVVHFLGNNNVVKNLTQIDDGEAERWHVASPLNVVVDGKENTLQDVTIRSTGSYPYGYGEIFGKGGGNVISHHKHSCVLIRGESNHIHRCSVYHNAYGHCLVMQAADKALLEDCYVEAQNSTTEAVYDELGSLSPADNVDFLTYFGFHMTDKYNYTMALCEEGIRAYNAGETMIDGVRYSRGTSNPTIKGNTIKYARGGVTLTHASGDVYVENCTTIGCGRGYALPNGATIVNCRSDFQYGPAYGVDYDSGKNNVIDITIIDQQGSEWITPIAERAKWIGSTKEYETCNGTAHITYIKGSGHTVKLREGRVKELEWDYRDYKFTPEGKTYTGESVGFCRIDLGGDDRGIGSIWKSDVRTEVLDENGDPTDEYTIANDSETINDDQAALTSSYIANETTLPVWVDSKVSGCTIYSNGAVFIEEGASSNTIYVSDLDLIVDMGGASGNTITLDADWDIDTCF